MSAHNWHWKREVESGISRFTPMWTKRNPRKINQQWFESKARKEPSLRGGYAKTSSTFMQWKRRTGRAREILNWWRPHENRRSFLQENRSSLCGRSNQRVADPTTPWNIPQFDNKKTEKMPTSCNTRIWIGYTQKSLVHIQGSSHVLYMATFPWLAVNERHTPQKWTHVATRFEYMYACAQHNRRHFYIQQQTCFKEKARIFALTLCKTFASCEAPIFWMCLWCIITECWPIWSIGVWSGEWPNVGLLLK